MKNIKNKNETKQRTGKLPSGLPKLFAALGIIAAAVILIVCARTQDGSDGAQSDPNAAEMPTVTVLTPIPNEGVQYPIAVTAGIRVDEFYTADGSFPEDGSDAKMKNVLAVKLTNTTNCTLEYLTCTLTVNGEKHNFTAATVPPGKSVYVFDADKANAPGSISVVSCAADIELYFGSEPSAMTDVLSYEVQNGTVVVTNISDADISSDIWVYYKVTAENGYLGGITYRFRISGGLKAGERFNGYAPHAFEGKAEVMFAQYEE